MTISPWIIYGISVLDSVIFISILGLIFLTCIIIILGFALGSFIVDGIDTESEKFTYSQYKKLFKPTCIIWSILIFLVIVTPSSKTVAAIYVIPAIVNNEKIQNIGKNTLEGLEGLTIEWLKDLKKSKDKSD